MSTTAQIQPLRIRTTRLSWRRPHTAWGALSAPAAIGPVYDHSPERPFPAAALAAALTSTATLFVGFGLLALPAAAFA